MTKVTLRWEDAAVAQKTGHRLAGDDSDTLYAELAAAAKDGNGTVELRLDVAKHAFCMLQAYGAALKDNREFGRIDSAKHRIRQVLRRADYHI
jgi:hypothetical protein